MYVTTLSLQHSLDCHQFICEELAGMGLGEQAWQSSEDQSNHATLTGSATRNLLNSSTAAFFTT